MVGTLLSCTVFGMASSGVCQLIKLVMHWKIVSFGCRILRGITNISRTSFANPFLFHVDGPTCQEPASLGTGNLINLAESKKQSSVECGKEGKESRSSACLFSHASNAGLPGCRWLVV